MRRLLVDPSPAYIAARDAEEAAELERQAIAAREAAGQAALQAFTERQARRDAARLLLAGELTEEEADQVAAIFPPWRPGEELQVEELREFEGRVFVTIQAHTTQADWTPPTVPALFRVYRREIPPGEIPAWEPGINVAVGEVLTFNGRRWEVVQAHTTQAGWEPPAVPALWTDLGPI